jgi:cation transport ATPase
MRHLKGYPKWFNAKLISSFIAILVLSGFLLIPTVLELHLEWTMLWRADAADRIWIAAIHAGLSFLMLWLLGALWPLHMRQGWRTRKKNRSGILLVSTWGVLGVTALGIYYASNGVVSKFSSLTHTFFGVLVVILYISHLFVVKTR